MRRLLILAVILGAGALAYSLRAQKAWHPGWKEVRPSAELGWELIPSKGGNNSHGMMGPEFPKTPTPGVERVLLIGDSFIENKLLPEELSQAAKAAGLTRAEFLRGGMRGYATDHYLLWYRLHGRKLKAKTVVLFWYAGNDLSGIVKSRDNQGYQKPWFTLEQGALVLHGSPIADPKKHFPADALAPWITHEWKDLLSPAQAMADRGGRKTSAWRLVRGAWNLHYWLYDRLPPYRRVKDAVVGWRRGSDPKKVEDERALGDLWHLRNFAYTFFTKGEDLEAAWRLNDALTLQLAKEVKEDGARFAVCLVPHLWQVDEESGRRFLSAAKAAGYDVALEAPSKRMAAFAAKEKIPFLDFTGPLRAASKGGMAYDQKNAFAHWSPLGVRAASQALADFLAARKLATVKP